MDTHVHTLTSKGMNTLIITCICTRVCARVMHIHTCVSTCHALCRLRNQSANIVVHNCEECHTHCMFKCRTHLYIFQNCPSYMCIRYHSHGQKRGLGCCIKKTNTLIYQDREQLENSGILSILGCYNYTMQGFC